jgi:hypothetical protein
MSAILILRGSEVKRGKSKGGLRGREEVEEEE